VTGRVNWALRGAVMCVLCAGSAVWAAPNTTIATVGPLAVKQQELDERASQMERDIEQRRGEHLTDAVRTSLVRQALETLIRARLYKLEANRRNVPVTDAEAEAELRKAPVFNPGGVFSPSAYEHARTNDPQKFNAAIAEIKSNIRANRFSESLWRGAMPPESQLRRAAERALESVDLAYFGVPTTPFTTSHREPAEREVVDYYRRHTQDFARVGTADVRVVEIAAGRAGESPQRIRARADSALVAVRGGMDLRDAADRYNGTARRFQLRSDNVPGSWRGTPEQNERLLRSQADTVFPELVSGERGWYVVQVERASPARLSTLSEASPVIRDTLRVRAQRDANDKQIAGLYQSVQDSLARPGYKVRYAVIDAAKIDVGQPTADDLTRFYELHQADYTKYDPATSSLVTTPLVQVRDELVQRWAASRRTLLLRDIAQQISATWSAGRRDKAIESKATSIVETGAVPFGTPIGTDPIAQTISDSLNRRVYDRRVETVPYEGGLAVAHVYQLVERVVPSFEQVRGAMVQRLMDERAQAEVDAAYATFQKDPLKYQREPAIHYSRLWVRIPQTLDVPLTRQEVLKRYQTHFADYASPEKYRVRHILVRAAKDDSASWQAAAQRARALLKRVRGGEDFAKVAEHETDDELTRSEGGDLGYRGAGELDPVLQTAAFALDVGGISDLVRDLDGYHILQVTEHLPEQAEPLSWVYTTVGFDEAIDKSQRIARQTADSLAQVIRTPAQAEQVAKQLGLTIKHYRHTPGDRSYPPEQLHMALLLESLKPGEMYPGSATFRGLGAAVMWVDSIAPPRLLDWEEAQRIVVPEYRASMNHQVMMRKLAELDSLMRAGWAFDSLAALWGGVQHDAQYVRGKGLAEFSGATAVDSLCFGTATTQPLAQGVASDWIMLPTATVRIRVDGRTEPDPREVERTMGQFRGIIVEYSLQNEIKSMKERFPVKILDPVLREVPLAPLPPMPEI